MQYYKVMKDNKPIDVLRKDEMHYLKYSKKHGRMFSADGINDAQAIFSSDKKHIWHTNILRNIPVDGYDTVELVEIDKYEYESLKIFNCQSPEELIDNYTLFLIEKGVL